MYNPKKISEKIALNNGYRKIIEKNFENENGSISNFLVASNARSTTAGIFVLPVTEDGKIIYLKEFRYGPEKFIINFPVGMLDDGLTDEENCSKELKEETGYSSDNIAYLGSSIIENYTEGEDRFYLAKNCKKTGNQEPENSELIEIKFATIEEFEKMILNGEVECAKSAYSFLLARFKGLI